MSYLATKKVSNRGHSQLYSEPFFVARGTIVSYDVTGMSPQSITLPQKLKGFDAKGTLYPPLNPSLREPLFEKQVSIRLGHQNHVLKIEASRTLSDATRAKSSSWSI